VVTDDVPPKTPDENGTVPFPDSLCHRCAAPPRYIRTARSTFIFCPVFKRYPPQPVAECERYLPRFPEEDGPT
jgi:hypothetical protein